MTSSGWPGGTGPLIGAMTTFDELSRDVAQILTQGQVVGWFQGRMEWGPRALGNRSILGDPRHPEMQKRLNLKIKYREGFRPFAPSVLYEETTAYFDLDRPSPYMLLVAPVKENRRNPCPKAMKTWTSLTASTTCAPTSRPSPTWTTRPRIQTVHKETNEKYWRLIQAFKELTGCGLIVNTSFNVRGEPIVCTPETRLPVLHAHRNGLPGPGRFFSSPSRTSPPGRKPATGAKSSSWINRANIAFPNNLCRGGPACPPSIGVYRLFIVFAKSSFLLSLPPP